MSPALTGGFFTTSATWEGSRLESMASQRVRHDWAHTHTSSGVLNALGIHSTGMKVS